MWFLLSAAFGACGDLDDWLETRTAAFAGFEEAYPVHLADAHRYRDTAIEAREIEWMVESPDDWRAVEQQAGLAAGHAQAAAEALSAMLDEVSEVGADCRKLEKRRAGLVVRHGVAMGAQQEALRLEQEASEALATLPEVEVLAPDAYDARIAALMAAAQAVSDGGGEQAAHELSALVRQLEPWELRAIEEQLPEHPVVQLTVAAALANTGDMRDVNQAARLQRRAGALVEEDVDILPQTAAVWGGVGLAKPNNGMDGGLNLSVWATPRRRVLLGAEWERQRLDAAVYSHSMVLGCLDLVGMEAYRPLVIHTGPVLGGGVGSGKVDGGKPEGALTVVLGWKVGVRYRRGSFLLFTLDFEARGTGTAKHQPPPTGMLNVGVGWSGYRPL